MPLIFGLTTQNDFYVSKNMFTLYDSLVGFFSGSIEDHYYSIENYNKMYSMPGWAGKNVLFS